jgi:type IV pilus assembly protein PilA
VTTWGKPVIAVRRPADTEVKQRPALEKERLRQAWQNRQHEDEGIALIELMAVSMIIAILLAIAIPTFLGAQNKAKDRSAQSSARNALTNAKTMYADSSTYAAVTPAALLASEPSLTFQPGVSTGPKNVSVALTPVNDLWFGAVLSATDTCFYIADNLGAARATVPAGTSYATGTAANCTVAAASAVDYSSTKW